MEVITEPKEFILMVKYLSEVEIYQDEKGNLINMGSIEVNEGPDGEIGIPGNIALLCNFAEGEYICAKIDEELKLHLLKIKSE